MKLFDLHADLGYAVWQKHEAGYTDILSSFYTDALRKGGIKAVFMACWFDGTQDFDQMCAMIHALKADIARSDDVRLVMDASLIDWSDAARCSPVPSAWTKCVRPCRATTILCAMP